MVIKLKTFCDNHLVHMLCWYIKTMLFIWLKGIQHNFITSGSIIPFYYSAKFMKLIDNVFFIHSELTVSTIAHIFLVYIWITRQPSFLFLFFGDICWFKFHRNILITCIYINMYFSFFMYRSFRMDIICTYLFHSPLSCCISFNMFILCIFFLYMET